MASCLQNKASSSSGAEPEKSSPDSLSFSGLICNQAQNPGSPPTASHLTYNQDPDFEFSHTRKDPTDRDFDPTKYYHLPANLLISNGKQQPAIGQPRRGSSPTPAFSRSRRPGDRTSAKGGSDKQRRDQGDRVIDHNSNAPGSGFGWKLFKSFASPCRECKAVTPPSRQTFCKKA